MQRQLELVQELFERDEPARALEQAAGMMELQAELFERTIQMLREPAEIAKAAAGLERRPARARRARKA